eukprot:TRINITY_DN88345_c0_g1_i1.p1 TRINITY_DN88345_c0_g1~~TRINITY_DN88345_c0_g1_i1.p1  ORF type:complete len:310 (-),score=62.63 TRINITY_DN88345_c0_g1_i1:41-970(-)
MGAAAQRGSYDDESQDRGRVCHGRAEAAGLRIGRQRPWGMLLLVVAATVVGILPGRTLSNPDEQAALRARSSPEPSAEQLHEALSTALSKVSRLRQEVDRNRIVPKYGQKSQAILQSLAESIKAADAEAAVDRLLHALFLRQLSLIQQKLTDRFLHARDFTSAISKADKLFLAATKDLIRPESSWSIETARQALRAELSDALQQEAILAEERSRAAQTQRATADVIGKIQKQMEQIGEKMKGAGVGSPWALWTSYHLPGTPFQVSGRYQDGRANIELNLAPANDPANAEAGFVEGLTPQNLGLSLNLGM